MAYTKKIWKDYPDTTTPILAEDLNKIENGIEELDTRVDNVESDVSNLQDSFMISVATGNNSYSTTNTPITPLNGQIEFKGGKYLILIPNIYVYFNTESYQAYLDLMVDGVSFSIDSRAFYSESETINKQGTLGGFLLIDISKGIHTISLAFFTSNANKSVSIVNYQRLKIFGVKISN